ncbi:MAG TPA: hypothetical protein VH255_00630 [Verrucomicrobiae bacterium]|nr:hypothetical protein [Verrucomicrobiae bacterium]
MIALVGFGRSEALLRKEKDGASLMNCFYQESLDAFIPCFAGDEGVFIFGLKARNRDNFISALVSQS